MKSKIYILKAHQIYQMKSKSSQKRIMLSIIRQKFKNQIIYSPDSQYNKLYHQLMINQNKNIVLKRNFIVQRK